MGRSVKYPRAPRVASSGIVISGGTTSQRPSIALNGTLRYNTDTSKFELYQNGSWINPTSRGKVTVSKDTFTGDGSTLSYALSQTPNNETGIQVFVGNVHQNPGASYTVSSNSLQFSLPPNFGQTIEVYHGFDSTDR